MTPQIGLVCFAIIMVELVRRREISEGHSGRPGRDRRRHAHRLGLEPVRPRPRRPERQGRRRRLREFRLLGAAPGDRPGVFGLRIPRHHPGHGDPVRHLRSRRGDGQCRKRRGRRRRISDHARADRRRRRQPDRLPDGQSLHQRGLYRPSRLEGDGRPHRLFGRDRHHGDRAVLVRHHLGAAGAGAGGRDLADPALHRHADRRAGVPDHADQACARDRAGADAASGGLGQAADRHHAGSTLSAAQAVGALPPTRSARSRPRRSPRCRSRACSITGWKSWAAARSSPASCSARSACS